MNHIFLHNTFLINKIIFFLFNGVTVFYMISQYLKNLQFFFSNQMDVKERRGCL